MAKPLTTLRNAVEQHRDMIPRSEIAKELRKEHEAGRKAGLESAEKLYKADLATLRHDCAEWHAFKRGAGLHAEYYFGTGSQSERAVAAALAEGKRYADYRAINPNAVSRAEATLREQADALARMLVVVAAVTEHEEGKTDGD